MRPYLKGDNILTNKVFNDIKKIFREASEMFFETDAPHEHGSIKQATAPTQKIIHDMSVSYNHWWQIENAKYHRSQCVKFQPYVLSNIMDYEDAFEDTLSKFFYSHGNWQLFSDFPDIHIQLIVVDVYKLKDIWNRRDIKLKEILLNELRKSYVSYAHLKRYSLAGLYNWLISGIWLVGNKLYLEFPISTFPINYSSACLLFVTDDYKKIISALNRATEL